MKLRPCTGEKPNQLRYLYDKLSIHIGGLINLGVTSETNATLVPVIMGKLPSDIRIQVARITRRDIWSLGELLELIENEVEANKWAKVSRLMKTDHNHRTSRRNRSLRTQQQRYMQKLVNRNRIFLVFTAMDLIFQLLVNT